MNAEEIIAEAKSILTPRPYIEELIRRDCCIMDDECCGSSYKDEGGCLDYKGCDDESYMLACLATRSPEQLAPWVIEVCNKYR